MSNGCRGSVMGWGSRYNTPLVIELKACVKQCSVLIRVFDAFRFAAVTMHAIYECGQLFASIQLGGGLIFVVDPLKYVFCDGCASGSTDHIENPRFHEHAS